MRARAHLSIVWLATLAAGCGGPLKAGSKDAAPPLDGGLEAFCTGDEPRMVVNGVGLTPTLSSYPIVMDCCDGGRLVVTNDALAFPIGVGWLVVEPGPTFTLPATIDLASPPEGWQIQLIAGCSVTSATCAGPQDNYRTGLVGWLTIVGYAMSICVHVEEDPAEPANLLHSLDLYVPPA